MARHLAPFSCRQTRAESVRRRSWGGVLPLGRHCSTSGSSRPHCVSVSIAPPHLGRSKMLSRVKRFKVEQTLSSNSVVGQRMAVSLGVELSNRFVDGAVEVIRTVERLMSEVM